MWGYRVGDCLCEPAGRCRRFSNGASGWSARAVVRRRQLGVVDGWWCSNRMCTDGGREKKRKMGLHLIVWKCTWNGEANEAVKVVWRGEPNNLFYTVETTLRVDFILMQWSVGRLAASFWLPCIAVGKLLIIFFFSSESRLQLCTGWRIIPKIMVHSTWNENEEVDVSNLEEKEDFGE